MSKFTPGPWKAAENATGTDIMIWSGAYPVAVVRDAHEKQANAHLISAAPELLEASKWAVGMAVTEIYKLEQMKLVKPDIGSIDPEYIDLLIEGWRRILNQCQSAIDKAEGISQ
jgi:hypothetical protein